MEKMEKQTSKTNGQPLALADVPPSPGRDASPMKLLRFPAILTPYPTLPALASRREHVGRLREWESRQLRKVIAFASKHISPATAKGREGLVVKHPLPYVASRAESWDDQYVASRLIVQE